MSTKKEKQRKSLLIVIIAGVLLIYFSYVLISQQIKINQLNKEISATREKQQVTKEEIEELEKEIDEAGSREAIEKIAREMLNLLYPDEIKYVDTNNQ